MNMNQLRSTTEKLNSESDRLITYITQIDDALRAANIGLEGWIPGISYDLGYAKIGDRWGLAIKKKSSSGHMSVVTPEHVWAFKEAPRKARIEASRVLPQLISELAKSAEAMTNDMKEAADFTESIQRELGLFGI